MKDTFKSYHPIINFIYFIAVIGISMFVMHPVFLLISFVGSLSYAIYLGGVKVIYTQLLYSLPLCIIIGLINPLFNHEGITILMYLGENPLTLESIYYGCAMAVLFINVMLWFYVYQYVMTSDKLIYLMGRKLPNLSLIFSMTLRFVPLFQRQFKKVMSAQEGIGNSSNQKSIFEKIRWGSKVLSIMITWILETAIDTADSMKSRGYGLKGRTSFSNYTFKGRDIRLLIILILLLVCLGVGLRYGVAYVRYFPSMKFEGISLKSGIVYLIYGALCMLPVSLHLVEDMKWRYLR